MILRCLLQYSGISNEHRKNADKGTAVGKRINGESISHMRGWERWSCLDRKRLREIWTMNLGREWRCSQALPSVICFKKKKRGRGEGTNWIQEILSEHKETIFFYCVGVWMLEWVTQRACRCSEPNRGAQWSDEADCLNRRGALDNLQQCLPILTIQWFYEVKIQIYKWWSLHMNIKCLKIKYWLNSVT